MAGGGFSRQPDGSVIVALTLPRPGGGGGAAAPGRPRRTVPEPPRPGSGRRPAPASPETQIERHLRDWSAAADAVRVVRSARDRPGREPWIRVLVHAKSRPRALTRLRNLGFRAVYLKGNAEPPTPEEIDAVLHHPERLVWRAAPVDEAEPWHPIAHLLAAYRAPHPAPAPKPPQLPDAPVLRRGG